MKAISALSTVTQADLDGALTGAFAAFSGRLRRDPDPAACTLQELGRSGALADALATFADAHPGCERPAVASLWSAYLFAGLIAPTLAAGARLGRDLPLGSLHLAPTTGLPATVHLAQEFAWPASLPAQVDRLLAESVAPVIRSLRTETGLSTRLLWENAGGHLFWTLSEIRRENPGRTGEVTEALRALRWPREACSALTLMRADAVAGCEPPRRRVCCLRHGLPGSSHCEGICPLLRRAGEIG
ncbi:MULTISPECIES: siderophore-iron reductase FhuF [unclassified Methylobacterium]|uniref:siderophore-iron reductase FhuF n=1 Tax=unclassified Methylobacterium TaxID=2615210 RepID=UPI0036F6EC11